MVGADHHLRRPARSERTSSGSAAIASGRRSPSSAAALERIGDAGQHQDRGDARPVRADDVGVGVVTDHDRLVGPIPLASRMAANIAGDGFPITSGVAPVAVVSAARIAPAPGRKPPGVG